MPSKVKSKKFLWKAIQDGDMEMLQFYLTNNPDVYIKTFSLNRYGWNALHAACYFGHSHLVQYLVEVHHMDVNLSNSNGWHSLIFAAISRSDDVVQYLVEKTGVDPFKRDAKGYSALCYAR